MICFDFSDTSDSYFKHFFIFWQIKFIVSAIHISTNHYFIVKRKELLSTIDFGGLFGVDLQLFQASKRLVSMIERRLKIIQAQSDVFPLAVVAEIRVPLYGIAQQFHRFVAQDVASPTGVVPMFLKIRCFKSHLRYVPYKV